MLPSAVTRGNLLREPFFPWPGGNLLATLDSIVVPYVLLSRLDLTTL